MEVKNRCCSAAHLGLGALALATFFSGCVTPFNHEASATRNNAFIDYWPPPKDSTDFRLAVKDLIDLKGVMALD